ncbi:intradiol ring-cleavage dioxygenase [Candidatus Poribacteria bacterium]|nr:intradiol ring-cleavage dioxygenase [Candidatus Poribacteria bacterium]
MSDALLPKDGTGAAANARAGTNTDAGTGGGDIPKPDCVLSPQQTEGPFYFDIEKVRRDITEGKPGISLTIALTVVSAETCLPVADALVDIWHADAEGVYSAFAHQLGNVDTRGQTFLRGIQVTDINGKVAFTTIYPGWYPGRTTHVHFKVHLDNQTVVTSQLYFPDEPTFEVYAQPPYAARGQRDTNNENDGVLRPGQLESLLMTVVKDGVGYRASHTIGIA